MELGIEVIDVRDDLIWKRNKQKKNKPKGKTKTKAKGKQKRKPAFDYSSRRTITGLMKMKKRHSKMWISFPISMKTWMIKRWICQQMWQTMMIREEDSYLSDEERRRMPDISEIANDSVHVPFRDWTCSIVNRRRGKSLFVVFQKGYVGKAISRRGKLETRGFHCEKNILDVAFLPRPHTRGKYWTFSSGGEIDPERGFKFSTYATWWIDKQLRVLLLIKKHERFVFPCTWWRPSTSWRTRNVVSHKEFDVNQL